MPVVVAWDAWSPFDQQSRQPEQTVTVALRGGPSISPDQRLCFRNEYKLRSDQPCIALPTVNVQFHFALKSEVH